MSGLEELLARLVDPLLALFGVSKLQDPLMLLLLLPLAALVLGLRRRRAGVVDGASQRLLGDMPATWRVRARGLPSALLVLAAALLVLALARPLQGREESKVITEGLDIMLVVDISSSMTNKGLDEQLTNLDVVKEVVTEFVRARPDDRLGVISFAAYPRTESPLTLDHDSVLERVRMLECVRSNGPEDGTAIGVALGHAARKLMNVRDEDAANERETGDQIIVLLTDGDNTERTVDPEEAAALCADLDIKVYTVGAGAVMARDLMGRLFEVPYRTELLEHIAATTGGRFYRAKTTDQLDEVYKQIDELERAEREDVGYTEFDELYPWLLLPAALLLLMGFLLSRGAFLEFAS